MAVFIRGRNFKVGGGASTPPAETIGTPNTAFGYASLNGGTTGNTTQNIISVTNYDDLKAQVQAGNRTVIVADNISGNGTTDYGWTNHSSNVTVVGANPTIEITGMGMWWSSISVQTQNIIIRNLKMSSLPDLEAVGKSHVDYLTFKGSSDKAFNPHNMWIDHCHLVGGANGGIDGLLDITNGCDFGTISNCKFELEGNANLLGNADPYIPAPTREQMRITMAYNWYINCGERQPKTSMGRHHIIHNLVERNIPYGGTPGSGYKGYGIGYGHGGHVRVDGMILLNEDNMYMTYNTQGTDEFGNNVWGRLLIGEPIKLMGTSTGGHYQPQPLLTEAEYPIPYEFANMVKPVGTDAQAQVVVDYIHAHAGNTLTLADMGL